MAISIVIEDGTVVASANAYEAVATADTWLTDRGFTAFNGAADQPRALVEGTRIVEDRWGHLLGGSIVNEDQTLLWPRYDAPDFRGVLFDSDEIPENWKAACRLMADYYQQAVDASRRLEDSTGLDNLEELALRDARFRFGKGGPSSSLSQDYPEAWSYARRAMPEVWRLARA